MTLQERITAGDDSFDQIYPATIEEIVPFHFSLVAVAQAAAQYLVDREGARILDIGAGAGKFCMVGATCTQGHFTGVEQRAYLVDIAQQLSREYQVSNTQYIHSNITDIHFQDYIAFFHFNAFFEHKDPSSYMDTSIAFDKKLYTTYSNYVKAQLAAMPVGTRLATYFSYKEEIPTSYEAVEKLFGGKLIFWEKR